MVDCDAYDEGYDAYWDGTDHEENPYDEEKDRQQRQSWDEGWRAARRHDYDEGDG